MHWLNHWNPESVILNKDCQFWVDNSEFNYERGTVCAVESTHYLNDGVVMMHCRMPDGSLHWVAKSEVYTYLFSLN